MITSFSAARNCSCRSSYSCLGTQSRQLESPQLQPFQFWPHHGLFLLSFFWFSCSSFSTARPPSSPFSSMKRRAIRCASSSFGAGPVIVNMRAPHCERARTAALHCVSCRIVCRCAAVMVPVTGVGPMCAATAASLPADAMRSGEP